MESQELKIFWRERNSKTYDFVSVEVKKDPKIYEKDFSLSKRTKLCEFDAKTLANRIKWADSHGFRLSNSWRLEALKKSNKWTLNHLHNLPTFFDHTSFWRFEGDHFPRFCLTEPYSSVSAEKEKKSIQKLNEEGFQVKCFPLSEYSLHYPNQTSMVFIWHPDFFTFEDKYWKVAQ
jgi:hypothetical protein